MKNFTLGQKIAGGFAALIVLAGVLGGVAAITMNTVRDEAQQMTAQFVPEASLAAALNDASARTQLAARSYGFTGEAKYLDETRDGIAQIAQALEAARKLSNAFPDLVKLRTHLSDIATTFATYKETIDATVAKNQVIAVGREKLDAAAATFMGSIEKIIQAQDERLDREAKDAIALEKFIERHRKLTLAVAIRGEGNAVRVTAFKAQALRTPALIAESSADFDAMAKQFTELKGMLKVPADLEELEDARLASKAYETQMQDIMRAMLSLDEIGQRRMALGTRLFTLSQETAAVGMQRTITAADDSSAQLSHASTTVQVMLGCAIALGLAVAVVLIRGITRVLRAATDSLITGSEQIVAAAGQVSSASQSLAAGASEQAASIEETTASIEEMSGMTKSNATSAEQAREIARGARHSADQSAGSVAKLNVAMSELKASSAEVAKIVKSIDEIAFQTNLLALNAAVEAARAGEAGAGFAVVAEEVRSLAQRSAQAAKETAGKIDTALAKSEDGARISEEVSGHLNGIIEQVRKLDTLVNEIAQASKEQSQGIGQVNDAVNQIDKITQLNAAAAEESASAAEELNAQAGELNNLVGGLLLLVGGQRVTNQDGVAGEPKPGGVRHRDPSMPTAAVRPTVARPNHAPAAMEKIAHRAEGHRGPTVVVASGAANGELDKFFH